MAKVTPPFSFGQQSVSFYFALDLTEIVTPQAFGYDHAA